jgi:hypothetical protein
MMFPGIVFVFAWFLPESPRWLYTNGKIDKAKAYLTKYHGNGNPESEWVKLQMWEYEAHLELDGADKRWWDYRALFKDRASRYRLMCNCLTSLFGQWAGNGKQMSNTYHHSHTDEMMQVPSPISSLAFSPRPVFQIATINRPFSSS